MTAQEQCLAALRGFIDRAERAELAEAQASIIQFALASPNVGKRGEAMTDLQSGLTEAMRGIELDPMQQAFLSVIDAMIDRTRDTVLAKGA